VLEHYKIGASTAESRHEIVTVVARRKSCPDVNLFLTHTLKPRPTKILQQRQLLPGSMKLNRPLQIQRLRQRRPAKAGRYKVKTWPTLTFYANSPSAVSQL
jgi:hypothetical protein